MNEEKLNQDQLTPEENQDLTALDIRDGEVQVERIDLGA